MLPPTSVIPATSIPSAAASVTTMLPVAALPVNATRTATASPTATTSVATVLPATAGPLLLSLPSSLPWCTWHNGHPLALWNVYVKDFLGLVQGLVCTRRRVKRALLYTLNTVLHPLDAQDSQHHQDPASTKNMEMGDAFWDTIKTILGWIINTLDKNISLPPHLLIHLRDILLSIGSGQRRVALKKWQHILMGL
jgi:hypothetical protein